jgi:hypothetical protein
VLVAVEAKTACCASVPTGLAVHSAAVCGSAVPSRCCRATSRKTKIHGHHHPDGAQLGTASAAFSRQRTASSPETALPLLPGSARGYVDTLTERFTVPPAGTAATALINGIRAAVPVATNDRYDRLNDPANNKPVVYRDKAPPWCLWQFVHPLFKWFQRWSAMPLSDFNRGALVQPTAR